MEWVECFPWCYSKKLRLVWWKPHSWQEVEDEKKKKISKIISQSFLAKALSWTMLSIPVSKDTDMVLIKSHFLIIMKTMFILLSLFLFWCWFNLFCMLPNESNVSLHSCNHRYSNLFHALPSMKFPQPSSAAAVATAADIAWLSIPSRYSNAIP